MDDVDVPLALFQVLALHVHEHGLDLFLSVLEAFLDLEALGDQLEGLKHGHVVDAHGLLCHLPDHLVYYGVSYGLV